MSGQPAVYGPPSDLAILLTNIAAFVDREPTGNFNEAELREAAEALHERLGAQLAGAEGLVDGARR